MLPTGTASGKSASAFNRGVRMGFGRGVLISSLAVGVVAACPAAAAANNIARPVVGTRTGTTLLNVNTDQASTTSSGFLAHIGAFTGTSTESFTQPPNFTVTGTDLEVTAANGDTLTASVVGSGTATGDTSLSTDTITVTGGTGRFAGATGTLHEQITSTVVAFDPITGIVTYHDVATVTGTISY